MIMITRIHNNITSTPPSRVIFFGAVRIYAG